MLQQIEIPTQQNKETNDNALQTSDTDDSNFKTQMNRLEIHTGTVYIYSTRFHHFEMGNRDWFSHCREIPAPYTFGLPTPSVQYL